MTNAVSFQKVSFSYSDRFAIQNIDLEIGANEMVLISGPNGSGKTTILRLIATLLTPVAGEISILGHSVPAQRYFVRPRIGALFAEGYLFDELTVEENLSFYSRAYGFSSTSKSHVDLERWGMNHFRNVRVGHLSRGERQKVALTRTLLHSPSLILLDEPTTALDVAATQILTDILKDLHSSTTILCATHDPQFLRSVADRTIVIQKGRLQ